LLFGFVIWVSFWPFLIDLVDKAIGRLAETNFVDGESGNCRLGMRAAGSTPRMRAMFITWITLIAAGLVLYSIIGLSHN
jgi:hypothetical protein